MGREHKQQGGSNDSLNLWKKVWSHKRNHQKEMGCYSLPIRWLTVKTWIAPVLMKVWGNRHMAGRSVKESKLHRRKCGYIYENSPKHILFDPPNLFLSKNPMDILQFSSVELLSRVRLFATPWTAAPQASLPITNCRSSPKSMCIESVMPSSHLILSSPSPPASNPSQHQGLFQWVNSSHEVAKVLEFQPQHQSFQWTPRTGLL